MIPAFESLRVRHPGLCQQLETLLGKDLGSFGSWRAVYSAISSRDLIHRFGEIRGSSTERTLAAAIMVRCDSSARPTTCWTAAPWGASPTSIGIS